MNDNPAISRYVRVVHGSLGHPKFVGLTAAQRGTWLTALVLADIAHPEPIHEAAVRVHCQDADFEQLYERQLIERNGHGPGWFTVHDLKQFHVVPSATPEAVKERVRKHRAKKKLAAVTAETNGNAGSDIRDETIRDDSESFSRVGRPSTARAERPGRPE